jgi:hypothetical protein
MDRGIFSVSLQARFTEARKVNHELGYSTVDILIEFGLYGEEECVEAPVRSLGTGKDSTDAIINAAIDRDRWRG